MEQSEGASVIFCGHLNNKQKNMSEITPINPPPPNNLLTADTCQKIGGALARLNEIKDAQVIVTLHGASNDPKKTEQECRDLIEYLSVTLIQHATELIGCWFVVKGELQPLIQALMPLVYRVNANLAGQEKRNETV